eukprot:8370984-Pyramimonas_sp.AAC.1
MSDQGSVFGTRCDRGVTGGHLIRMQKSDKWGTPEFCGCVFCRRDRDCVNNLQHEKDEHPKLRFRGERHTICNSCSGTIRRDYPLAQSGPKRTEKIQELKNNDDEWESFTDNVGKYETEMNEAPAHKRRKVRQNSRGD